VINIPNIVSPLSVVDHYGVRARAVSPFPTFPIASSPPGLPSEGCALWYVCPSK
jgi:hypothetical protein